jgi:hypothetical protein
MQVKWQKAFAATAEFAAGLQLSRRSSGASAEQKA